MTARGPGRLRGAALAIVLVACGSERAAPAPTTGVTGTVTAGPTCPVERPGQSCPPSPVKAGLEVLDADGTRVGRTDTDARGRFEVRVDPGRYTLHVVVAGPFPTCPDSPVVVPGAGLVTADISCDTGIR